METNESMSNESESESTSNEALDNYGISQDLLSSIGIEADSGEKFSDNSNAVVEDENRDVEDIEESDLPKTEDVDGQADESESDGEKEFFELKHGESVEKYDRDKMIEFAQKGLDYTKKTMALSDERKGFETERTEWSEKQKEVETLFETKQRELSDIMNVKQVWDHYLNTLEKNNPDLYDQIQDGFNDVNGQFSNPIIQSQMEQLNEKMAQFDKQSQEQEFSKIRAQFNDEYKDLTSRFEEDYKKLGLKIDKDKVLTAWQKLEGVEKNSVKDAVNLLYGDQILKAVESLRSLNTTKKKVAAKKTAPTSGKVKGSKESTGSDLDLRKLSYEQVARSIINGGLN